jgi:hypothetical protein
MLFYPDEAPGPATQSECLTFSACRRVATFCTREQIIPDVFEMDGWMDWLIALFVSLFFDIGNQDLLSNQQL